MSIGFGIVGLGMIADFHARAIADAAGAHLVAACSRSEERAAAFAAEHGCRPYASLREMLADGEVDAVSVATPSGAHLEVILAAAAAGKHVITEKPLEVTAERCDRALAACRDAGVQLGGVFQSRFAESSRIVKAALDAGRLGSPVLGDAYIKWWRSQQYYDEGGWKGTRRLDGGGALMNQGIHAIDLLVWLMGPVSTVSARIAVRGHSGIEVEDTAVAALQFASGALGVIEGSTAVFPGYRKKIEISGTAGSITLVDDDIETWTFATESAEDHRVRERFRGQDAGGGGAADPSSIGTDGHRRQFEDFAASVAGERQPFVTGADAVAAVDVILAIYASAAEQRPVEARRRD